MVELDCPWCEAKLKVEWSARNDDQTCPECLTSWAYETTEAQELAMAA